MNETRRLCVPALGNGKGASELTAKLLDDPVVQKLSADLGRGRDTAVSNAQSVGRILKSALRRKKVRAGAA